MDDGQPSLAGIRRVTMIDKTRIEDLVVITPERHSDERGFFEELFRASNFVDVSWKQVNHSFSKIGVLRGIHVSPYAKLVTCIKGYILDVVVDLRPTSSTYLKWEMIQVSSDNRRQVYVPAHCGHAFLALDNSDVVYLQGGEYMGNEININYADPKIGIDWPKREFILSDKDKNAPFLE